MRGIERKDFLLIFSLLLAFFLWWVMFVPRPFNFWAMMAFSTLLLSAVAMIIYGRSLVPLSEFTLKNVLTGAASAIILYLIFLLGNEFLALAERLLPEGIISRESDLAKVYAGAGLLPQWAIALLLIFPIASGEELFWRGTLQRRLGERFGAKAAFAVTVLAYTLVHLSTGNLTLILAAFTCALYWGGLYAWRGSLVPVLVSHMLWDPLIFVLLPMR